MLCSHHSTFNFRLFESLVVTNVQLTVLVLKPVLLLVVFYFLLCFSEYICKPMHHCRSEQLHEQDIFFVLDADLQRQNFVLL